jgi:hypothetical protein
MDENKTKDLIWVYTIPLIASILLYITFGRFEGLISANMIALGSKPLQLMRYSTEYLILVWVIFFPIIFASYPVFYFTITKNRTITLNLIIEAVALYILSAVVEDFFVFALSPVLSYTQQGSVWENKFHIPRIGPMPLLYPFALASSIALFLYVFRDFMWKKK